MLCSSVTAMTDKSTPPPIQQLSDDIANKIAAGEVIERPAAVAKELIENSIDAGADRITVRIEGGGHHLLSISDNGHGMHKDDLALALSRHATSKLKSADDLFSISSLGFRGEALPSISAVSEFEIASRTHDADGGFALRRMGNQDLGIQACSMAPGTKVSVRNLFWNVPARLKFLKSESSESGHITDMVQRMAISHPHIAFLLQVGDKTIHDLPQHDHLEQRIRAIFGKNLCEQLLPIEGHSDSTQVTGFASHPSQATARAKRQFIFLNGRFIKDKLIIAAIREAYRGFLEPRLHPPVFMHIDTDPSLIDVNVHPTKAEVRFRNDREIFKVVRNAIRSVLEENSGGFNMLHTAATPERPQQHSSSGDIVNRTVVKAADPDEPSIQERFIPQTPLSAYAPSNTDSPTAVSESGSSYSTDSAQRDDTNDAEQNPAAQLYADDLPGIRKITQLNDMYLLIETSNGIRLVDQHALHEKAIYLCLDPDITDFEGSGRQELLIPKNIELTAAEVAGLEPILDTLTEHGIEAECFGPTTILLRAHPLALKKVNWQSFFEDMADNGTKHKSIETLRKRIAHSASCRRAVKAGDKLSDAEQRNLVKLLYTLEHMEHCPHGRPTTLDLSWTELERRFQR